MSGCSRTAGSTTPPSGAADFVPRAVGVAYSGGRDSTALLHATLASAPPLGIRVVALHVHHGLSPQAEAWLQHGKKRCRRWARAGLPIEFHFERLATRPATGESVEAWARRERYRALRRMAVAQGCDIVLLAHHRRDQAETFVLQALRGGGAAALSAMPRMASRDGVTWARPWLDRPREAIEAYVRRHRIRFVDDDSNGDTRFARNRLRSDVWPTLSAAFKDAEASLASAAGHSQVAAAAMAEWAEADLPGVCEDGSLVIAAWRRLTWARQIIVLRAWLDMQMKHGVPAALSDRLMREADERAALRWPTPHGELRSYRGRLRLHSPAPAPAMALRLALSSALSPCGADQAGACQRVDLSKPGTHQVVAWHGAFAIERVAAGGMPVGIAADLELRGRTGGERFQAGPNRPARSLKLQYQAAGIEAAERTGPLAFHGDLLVFAPGLGIDARAVATAGEAQLSLAWWPTSASGDASE